MFRIPSAAFGCAGIHFAVRLRQAKVCNYQHNVGVCSAFSVERQFHWEMIAPGVDELAHVTTLQIHLDVGEKDHVLWAGSIAARMPALRNLELELEEIDLYYQLGCCDSSVEVVQNICSPCMETGQPAHLKSLRIACMCLRHVGRLLTKVLDLSMLEHLQLINCADIAPFLRSLHPLNLKLSSFSIEKCDWLDTTEFGVNNFISSLKLLRRLTLQFPNIHFFDKRVLEQHYSSLESLRIEYIRIGRSPSVPETWSPFGHTPKLEQLAMSGFRFEYKWSPLGSPQYSNVQDLLVSHELDDFRHSPIPTDHT